MKSRVEMIRRTMIDEGKNIWEVQSKGDLCWLDREIYEDFMGCDSHLDLFKVPPRDASNTMSSLFPSRKQAVQASSKSGCCLPVHIMKEGKWIPKEAWKMIEAQLQKEWAMWQTLMNNNAPSQEEFPPMMEKMITLDTVGCEGCK